MGYPVPGDICYVAGMEGYMHLAAIKGESAYVEITDYRHWAYREGKPLLKVSVDKLRARPIREIAG
jgi:hypothetical protein